MNHIKLQCFSFSIKIWKGQGGSDWIKLAYNSTITKFEKNMIVCFLIYYCSYCKKGGCFRNKQTFGRRPQDFNFELLLTVILPKWWRGEECKTLLCNKTCSWKMRKSFAGHCCLLNLYSLMHVLLNYHFGL